MIIIYLLVVLTQSSCVAQALSEVAAILLPVDVPSPQNYMHHHQSQFNF